MKTYPRKKRINRHGLRLEQVQRVVATSLKLECVKTVKNKNVANISRHREVKEEIFLQAPCTSQAPFHAPIRGGYRGEGRLSQMDCSDTTQSLQVGLER